MGAERERVAAKRGGYGVVHDEDGARRLGGAHEGAQVGYAKPPAADGVHEPEEAIHAGPRRVRVARVVGGLGSGRVGGPSGIGLRLLVRIGRLGERLRRGLIDEPNGPLMEAPVEGVREIVGADDQPVRRPHEPQLGDGLGDVARGKKPGGAAAMRLGEPFGNLRE